MLKRLGLMLQKTWSCINAPTFGWSTRLHQTQSPRPAGSEGPVVPCSSTDILHPSWRAKLLIQAKGNSSRSQTSLKVAKLSSSHPSLYLSHCSSSTQFKPGSMLPFPPVKRLASVKWHKFIDFFKPSTSQDFGLYFLSGSWPNFSGFQHCSFLL